IKRLIKSKVPKHKILYLNFEDERINLAQSELDYILQAYSELYPTIKLEECYFFFDEIQNIKGWEKFIRRLYDTISTNIFISGSNAKLLSTEIATELRGRTITYTVYPLSFKEFLIFHKTDTDYYSSENKSKIIALSKKFLLYGGFPALIHQDEQIKIKILQDYFNTIIYKDLIDRYEISKSNIIKFYFKKIISNVTKPLSINKIYNDLKSQGYKIGNNILYQYLDYLQNVFAAVLVKKYEFSMIKQDKSEKKSYLIDNGFLTAIDYSFSSNYGKLLENMIALELIKAGFTVYYYKDRKECDFIIENRYHEKTAIQVSYDLSDDDTLKRELSGLEAACNYLKLKKGFIVSFEQEKKLLFKGIEVEIIPAYKFLLDKCGNNSEFI
ncbi:MAG: ATP-binding protein, partial [Bacteroidales bacterium]|nr:ATP-binding protein [Bacteroidales bacterium]